MERDILAQHNWTLQVAGSDYGLIGRDAQTLPGGIPIPAYTRLCAGKHSFYISAPIAWVTAALLAVLTTIACLAVFAWSRTERGQPKD